MERDLQLHGVNHREIERHDREKMSAKITRHFWYEIIWLGAVMTLYIHIKDYKHFDFGY